MKVINALKDDWQCRAAREHEDPNDEKRRFADSQEFACIAMERLLRQLV